MIVAFQLDEQEFIALKRWPAIHLLGSHILPRELQEVGGSERTVREAQKAGIREDAAGLKTNTASRDR